MQTSSQYPVLDNRPIDQWKFTELKEELKRRNLVTKGLKDELIKRLDEALRDETVDLNSGVHESDHVVADEAVKTEVTAVKTSEVESTLAINGDGESSKEVIVSIQEVKGSEPDDDQSEISSTDLGMKTCSPDSTNQVSETNPSLGFSINSVSVNEKIEVKDNVMINDDVKLESDVKLEMMIQSSSSSDLVLGGAQSHPVDVDKPQENKVTVVVDDTDNKVINEDISRINHLGTCEKLDLDHNDLMDEDKLESKETDSKFNSEEVGEKGEKSEVINMKEENLTLDNKRKLPEQEVVPSNEPSKRQHRWKKSNTTHESQISNNPSSAAKDVPKSIIPKRNFLHSDSIHTDNTNVKEREVPPSTKVATNSLRIDNFLRPFTLKAVQDLLSKTGTVTNFWMDSIKTHCYVTFNSVEEAASTRKAIYNLQWPPNGGRNLVADFVDPNEVKLRVDPPPPPPPPPTLTVGPTPPTLPPKPSPRVHQRVQQPSLPPPPPPPERVEGPTLTLDDLFKKTKTTPRIYYLPLSDEQVSAVLEKGKGSMVP